MAQKLLPGLRQEVNDVLAEFFPNGMPPSRTKQALAAGEAEVISTTKPERPLLDLTAGNQQRSK